MCILVIVVTGSISVRRTFVALTGSMELYNKLKLKLQRNQKCWPVIMCVEINTWWTCICNCYCMLTVLGWHHGRESVSSEHVPWSVFASWTIHHLMQASAVLEGHMSQQIDTSSFLVWLFRNIVEILNEFIQCYLRQAVAQFQSKPINSGVSRQIESALIGQSLISIQEPR
jgi:hypothetical protein